MHVTSRCRTAGALLLIASTASSQSVSVSSRIGIADAVGWLPPTTETLIVARGPIDPAAQGRGPVDAVTQIVMGGLVSDGTASAIRHLRGSRLRFAVEGARGFRAPQQFGVAPYEGCHILVFEDSESSRLDEFMTRLASSGTPATVGGVEAVRLKWREEKDDWLAFVVRPRRDVLIIATNEAMLAETITRSRSGSGDRAFPSQLPEWSGVDTTARVWAIRHYLPARNGEDPTSPLTSQRRAANNPDTMAVGLALHVVDGDSARVVAHYYSTNPRADSIAQRIWWPERIQSTSVGLRGSIRVVVAPTRPELWGDVLFMLLARLGHVIYL